MKCTKLLFVHILIIVTLDEMYKALALVSYKALSFILIIVTLDVQSSCSFTIALVTLSCTSYVTRSHIIIVTLDEMYKALVRSHIDYCDT